MCLFLECRHIYMSAAAAYAAAAEERLQQIANRPPEAEVPPPEAVDADAEADPDAESTSVVAEKEVAPAAAPLEPLPPYNEILNSIRIWSEGLAAEPFASSWLSLKENTLPFPPAVLNLIYVVSLLLQIPSSLIKNEGFGEISTPLIKQVSAVLDLFPLLGVTDCRQNIVDLVLTKVGSFQPNQRVFSHSSYLLSNIKGYIETNNVLDASLLPTNIAIFGPWLTWIQKAVAAKENVQASFAESNPGEEYESVGTV